MKFRYKVLCVIFLIMHSALSFTQINLVVNPSIEITDTCPTFYGQIMLASGWDTLRNGGGNTPDLYNECYLNPNNYCSVPVNWWNSEGYQYYINGKGYAGFLAYPNIREIIQGTLHYKLINEKEYCVKIYINLSNFSKYSIESMGIYFDNGQVSCLWNSIPNVVPQVTNIGQQLDDTLIWTLIEDVFTANGTETFISITNFSPDSLSNPVLVNPSATSNSAYYYIDDVSVIEADLPAHAGNDTIINPGDSVFIGRQPEIGLNDDCIWYVNGTAIDTVAGLWVYPDSTTTYILVQTICGNVDTDSVTVYVFPVGMPSNRAEYNDFIISPNPNNGNFSVSLFNNLQSPEYVVIEVWSLTGTLVKSGNLPLKNNKAILNMNLPDGMYIVSMSDDEGNTYHPKKITVIN